MSRLLVAQRALTVPGWAKNALWRSARAVPSLDLRFADNKSLVDAVTGASMVTYTRASSGTYVDSAGVLQTAAIGVPRFDHDPTTGESLGLLVEEQRTQILELTDTLATQTKTVTATAHTLSFYGSGTVVLSGVHSATVVGTGAYPARTTLTFTPTAGSLTLTVTGTVQFAQLEAGAFATSYIPNPTTAAVTRSPDVASITGTAFSGWYRQDEGTVFAELLVHNPANHGQVGFDDGLAERWRIGYLGTGAESSIMVVVDNSVVQMNQATSSPGTWPVNASRRAAAAYKLNDMAMSLQGVEAVVDSAATVPTPVKMTIGAAEATTQMTGTIRRLTYWGQHLPNSTLQALTQ